MAFTITRLGNEGKNLIQKDENEIYIDFVLQKCWKQFSLM